MRAREILFPGAAAPVVTPYYQREIYSTWTLATGQTGYQFFANVEAVNLRNYNLGQNIFVSNRGSVLALVGGVFAPAYGQTRDLTSAASGDIADAINAILAQGELTITKDSDIEHKCLLQSIFGTFQNLQETREVPTPVNDFANAVPAIAAPASPWNRDAAFPGYVPLSPPSIVDFGRTIGFTVTLPQGVAVDAVANNFILQLRLLIEEYPVGGLEPIRA